MNLRIQWQKVYQGGDPQMTDLVVITKSNPQLLIDNARLAYVDLLPNHFAVLYSKPNYQGDSVRVYADEQLLGLNSIGSLKLGEKSKADYDLVQVNVPYQQGIITRLLPQGVYNYNEMGVADRSHLQSISTPNPDYEIEHFQLWFQLKRKDKKPAITIKQGSQRLSILEHGDQWDVDVSDGLQIDIADDDFVCLLEPIHNSADDNGEPLQVIRILQSTELQGMGMRVRIKKEAIGFAERFLRDHMGVSVAMKRDVMILFILVISIAAIVALKLWPGSRKELLTQKGYPQQQVSQVTAALH